MKEETKQAQIQADTFQKSSIIEERSPLHMRKPHTVAHRIHYRTLGVFVGCYVVCTLLDLLLWM